MMRTTIVALSCFFVAGLALPAWAAQSREPALPVHGVLTFKVKYLGLTCGQMTLESRMEDFQGLPSYHIQMKAKNSKFFNRIYKVETQIDSWVDAETLSTLRYESTSDEKGKRHSETIRVEKGEIIWTKKGKDRHFDLLPDEAVLDPLAYLYRLQSYAVRPGFRPRICLITTKGPMETVAQVSGLMKMKTAFGKRKIVKIHPRPVDGKMFSRKGELSIFVEPGPPPLLRVVEFDLSFGHLKAVLVHQE